MSTLVSMPMTEDLPSSSNPVSSPAAKAGTESSRQGREDRVGVAAVIERLRRHRTRRGPQADVSKVVSAIRREAAKQQRNRGGLTEVWEDLVPESLRLRTRIRTVRSGILRILVADPSTRYEVETFLRGGGTQELRLRSGQPIRQVRCEVDSALEQPRTLPQA